MTTTTLTLTDFLLARIAEDEAIAERGRVYAVAYASAVPPGAWDTARVLAECEAKRRIVEEHAAHDASTLPVTIDYQRWVCRRCCSGDPWDGYEPEPFPCDTLKHLALPYADHGEFQEEWRA